MNKVPKSPCCSSVMIAIRNEETKITQIICGRCRVIMDNDGKIIEPTEFYKGKNLKGKLITELKKLEKS